MADIYLKKEDIDLDIMFDISIQNNDALSDDSYVTAAIASIFTDASKNQIGTQIDGKTLGNKEYNLEKLSKENIKLNEDGLKEALQWLIDDGIVQKFSITSVKNGNRLDRTISFLTSAQNSDNLIFSLDENLNILSY